MILVPVKNLAHAKQRLASVMEQPERTQLAQAMLDDVLLAIANWGGLPCTVVSSDPYACELAGQLGLEVILDPENPGETGAIEMATGICVERGCVSTLVLPADIPLLQPEELSEIVKHAPARGSLLVPAGDGRGTNAAFRSPADLFPLRFGNDSFKPHLAAARATGLPCVVIELPGVAVDVDRPDDLYQLASLPGETRAQQFVREFLRGSELLPTGSDPA
jgi:2-phospho-L-lactate/phosphoenolpyruvate guanylyltransferase